MMKTTIATRSLRSLALSVVLSISAAFEVFSQQPALNLKSTDPQGDSIAILQIKDRLDMIRKERPTVVVVLSGGGAKGAAHVGVLKYLEEKRIPVDAVIGTSMGGLVGGLYSLGYNAEQLDTIIHNLDWGTMMLDRVPQEFIPYEERRRKDTYLVDIPFYYKYFDIFNVLRENERIKGLTSEQKEEMELNIGAGSNDWRNALVQRNFASTLPSAMVIGHNVLNAISSMTVGYQSESLDFVSLPRPFICIATEMVSGRQKIWHQGNIATAMRSTMSIPGLFAPVRIDGMVLTDGGMRNNYPTDIARIIDPDYIIGVELSDKPLEDVDINNIGNIVDQMITILGKETFDRNENLADVKIKPDLDGYTMLSFTKESIDEIVKRGYRAAEGVASQLAEISERTAAKFEDYMPDFDSEDLTRKEFTLSGGSIFIGAIEYNGITGREVAYLESKFQLKAGVRYSKDQIENVINEIYGSGAFSSVSYQIHGDLQPYKLEIDCRRKPIQSVSSGFRMDTETLLSAIVDVNLNGRSVEGHALDISARISGCPYAKVHYSYKGVGWPTLNVQYYAGYFDANLYEIGRNRISLRYNTDKTEAYLSDLKWRRSQLRGGFRSQNFNIQEILSSVPDEYKYVGNTGYLSMFIDTEYKTFNDTYFPKTGVNLSFSSEYVFAGFNTHLEPFFILYGKAASAFPVKENLTLLPRFEARIMFGEDIPVPFMNMAGGHLAGRFISQQIPFIGIDYATPLSDKLVIGSLDLRWNPIKNHYLTASTGVLHDFQTISRTTLKEGDFGLGIGLQYAYDTIVGPFKVDVHWSNITKFGAYLSLGYDF